MKTNKLIEACAQRLAGQGHVDKAHADMILGQFFGELVEAAQEFIDRVESGKTRSVHSYNRFKKALGQ